MKKLQAMTDGQGPVWRAGAEVLQVFKCTVCKDSHGMHEVNAAVHGAYPVL